MDKPRAFLALDALRGFAAFAILNWHFGELFGAKLAAHSVLGVQFFFTLSGFVLTYAYQDRLDSGWSTVAFLKTRLIRLYPLLLVGILISALKQAALAHVGRGHFSIPDLALALFMLPSLPTQAHPTGGIFPLDVPAWSLFFEVVANLAHALFLRRRSPRFLWIVAAVSGSIYFGALLAGPRSVVGGDLRETIYLGFPEVVFCYVLGMLVFHYWKQERFRLTLPIALVILALAVVLACPMPMRFNFIYESIAVIALFPMIIMAGACTTTPRSFAWLFHGMGVVSYAVYILHWPLEDFFDSLWKSVRGHRALVDAPWSGIVYLLLVVAICLFLDRYYDEPVRRWLRRKFTPNITPSPIKIPRVSKVV